MAINPRIKQKAEDIRNKIFGSEVRESLASGIEAISEDVEATIGRQDYVEEQFQDIIDATTDKDVINGPEIIAARNGEANLKARLDKEKNEVTAQLQHTAKQGEITKDDFDTSTDSKKIGLNNLNDEARQAMTGNSPVFEGLPANSLVAEYFADRAVTDRVIDYVNADKINYNLLKDPYFEKMIPRKQGLPPLTEMYSVDGNGDLFASLAGTPTHRLDSIILKFPENFRLSFKTTVDPTKTFGALIGFRKQSTDDRLLIGYEPARGAVTLYTGSRFVDILTNVSEKTYSFEWEKQGLDLMLRIDDQTFYISDYIPDFVFDYDQVHVQLKSTDLGLKVSDLNLSKVEKAAFDTVGVKMLSKEGKQSGKKRHIYQFGGKGNDWCYVYTPQGYNPDREKPYPLVIQNHGNGSNFDGTPQYTIWTTIQQYRPQAEYDANPERFLLSPSTDLDYSSPTIEALLDAGYIVCGAMNYGDGLYGNNDCRNAMADFYQHMVKNYNVEERVNLMGASNGFMTSLNGAYVLGGRGIVKAMIGLYPLADLVAQYINYPNHQSAIESAYGIPSGLSEQELISQTRTYNQETQVKQIAFPPIKMWYSQGDTTTAPENNALSLAGKLESELYEYELVEVTGAHGDQSHFDPTGIVEWFNKWN